MGLLDKIFPNSSRNNHFSPWKSDYFIKAIEQLNLLAARPPIKTFLRYEILKNIEGGMADVSIARREGSKVLFALKTYKSPKGFDSKAKTLFAEEISKMIDVPHDGLLNPDDVVWHMQSDSCVLVLPYCAGGSLNDRCKAGLPEIQEIIYYALSVAASLVDLHNSNILHLDLKPHNILLQHDIDDKQNFVRWNTTISDFGIARHFSRGLATGASGGTRPYMAPEQFLNQALSRATDIWGFGATIYHIATGRLPFGVDGYITANGEKCNAVPQSIADIRPGCPIWFSDMIMKCLETVPARRWQSLDAVLNNILLHVRIEGNLDANGKASDSGYSGASESKADIIIHDTEKLFHLCLQDRAKETSFLKITTGWIKLYHEAGNLHSTHEAGPARKAIFKLDTILGSWDDPLSPLGHYLAHPRQAKYDITPYWDKIFKNRSGKYVRDLHFPITDGAVRTLLDLKCMCLVTAIEDLAIPADIDRFRDLINRWLQVGFLGWNYSEWSQMKVSIGKADGDTKTSDGDRLLVIGPPREMCLGRMAQGARLTGNLDLSKQLTLEALKTAPKEFMLLMLISLIYHDTGDFEAAINIAHYGIKIAVEQQAHHIFIRWQILLLDYLLDVRRFDESLEIAKHLSDRIENFHIFLPKINARRYHIASSDDLNTVLKYAETSNELQPWIIAAELAFWARHYDKAREIAGLVLRDPRIYLPIWKEDFEICTNIARDQKPY